MMKIYNNILPFKGFLAMTVWPFMFIRKEYMHQFIAVDENHETIHAHQQKEVLATLLAVMSVLCLTLVSWWWMVSVPSGFYALYGLEYIIRLIGCGDAKKAYRSISFEQEAFAYERDFNYLKGRKHFAWIKYLTKTIQS